MAGQPIPLGLSAYKRAQLPPVTLKNLFYERAPTQLSDNIALLPRPRLTEFTTAGDGPLRGLYRKGGVPVNTGFSGYVFALSGTTLYRIRQAGTPDAGNVVSLGTIEGSASRMSAEGNADVLMLTCGTKLYTSDAASVTEVDFPDGLLTYAVDTLDSYFLIASDNGRFYWTDVGAETIDALNYATAESQPDILLTLKVIGDELWLFGRLSIEVWQPTGDLDLPFQRINGRIFGIGITARDTCQKLNVNGIDTVCWVGTDRRVYRTNPNPQRISDNGLEERLRNSTVSLSDNTLNPYAETYSWDGHDFYVLHIPGQGSFAYDLATGLWDELTSYDHPTFRACCSCVGPNAQPLLGDDTDGTIWQMSADAATDGDDPVVFEFSGLLEVPGAPVRCNNVMLDVSGGTTADPEADPLVQMAYSEDDGQTFSDEMEAPLGRSAERRQRVMWSRLGQLRYPGRILRWRLTQPMTIKGASYNESFRR